MEVDRSTSMKHRQREYTIIICTNLNDKLRLVTKTSLKSKSPGWVQIYTGSAQRSNLYLGNVLMTNINPSLRHLLAHYFITVPKEKLPSAVWFINREFLSCCQRAHDQDPFCPERMSAFNFHHECNFLSIRVWKMQCCTSVLDTENKQRQRANRK